MRNLSMKKFGTPIGAAPGVASGVVRVRGGRDAVGALGRPGRVVGEDVGRSLRIEQVAL